MRRLYRVILILLLFPALLAVGAGWFAAPSFLHSIRWPLFADLIQRQMRVLFPE